MEPLLEAATIAVATLGVSTLLIARFRAFRQDFRRGVSITVGAVALLTVLLSLHVLLAGLALQASATPDQQAMVNGLLLAGFMLLLVSTLAFCLALGVLIWTFVSLERGRFRLDEPVMPAAPGDAFTR